MKKKELGSLRVKKIEELKKLVKEKKLALAQIMAKTKGAAEKNLKKGKNLRREIAQTLTIIRENELLEKK